VMACKTTLETIWYIPDDLWDKVRPLLGPEKQAGTVGRPAIPHRTCLDGILYVLRTGCQWKHAPAEFGSGSTLHRRFQQWVGRGVFKRIWRLLIKEYEGLRGIRWRWQAIDSATTKATLGGEATQRTSRSATGSPPSSEASDGTSRSGGWSSARTVGRTATADCWCGGRRKKQTMWLWFISLLLSISTD